MDLQIDTRAFSRFAKALKSADRNLANNLRKKIRAGAEIVAADARSRASFSKRIPGAIRVRTSGASVAVEVDKNKAPNAKPIENDGKGHVRHPVFGDRAVWTDKNSRPAFLHPALESKREEATLVIAEAIEETLRTLGGEF